MGGKDSRSRQARRGSRRAHRELAQVATQVAQAAVDGDAEERVHEGPLMPGQLPTAPPPPPLPPTGVEALEPSVPLTAPAPPPLPPVLPPAALQPAMPLPTIDEEKRLSSKKAAAAMEGTARSPAHALLKVPTPVRSPKAMELSSSDSTPKAQGSNIETRFSMPSAGPALGPEPWGLQSESAPPSAAQKGAGGYREWLQARGQQAMQRSLIQGSSPANRPQGPVPPLAPPPSTPAPCPGTVASVLPGLAAPPVTPAGPPPAQMVSWGVSGDMQLQQWFGVPGVEMSPVAGQQTPLGFGGCSQQSLMLPGCGQQSPMAYSCQQGAGTPMNGQQSPLTFGTCGQQPTIPFSGCQQGPATPIGGQQTPLSFGVCPQGGAPPSGQQTPKDSQHELIAALMPGGFTGLDSEQIAAQLRAAAPCSYDD